LRGHFEAGKREGKGKGGIEKRKGGRKNGRNTPK